MKVLSSKSENISRLITIIYMMMLLFSSCCRQTKERVFINKYEFEDFYKFKGINIFKRGTDKNNNQVLIIDAPYFVNGTSKVGCYVVILDKQNYHIIDAKWTTEYEVNADTAKLQQLAQTFMKYGIPRLDVDTAGNVFVYLKGFETLVLAQFVNESELHKRSKETKWVNVTGNWYKPKR